MDAEDMCMEEEENLDNTNIELHPSLTFDDDEVLYLDVVLPDPIVEDNNVQPDPNVNPW